MRKLFILLFLCSLLYSSDKTSMAVYEFDGAGVTEEIASSVADFVQDGLAQSGRIILIERKNVQKVLKEQMFQKTGCTSTDCAVEVGKMLNVGNIVTGRVSKTGTRFVISINLIDVEAGKVILTDSIECGSLELLNTASKKLALHFSKGVSVKGKILKILENEVIINLGIDDGIKNTDPFAVERLGEAVKDDNGKIAFQEKTKIGIIEVIDAASSGSKAKIREGYGRIKIGDVIELKIEKMQPLSPVLSVEQDLSTVSSSQESTYAANTEVPKKTLDAYSLFGTLELNGNLSFSRYDTSNVLKIAETNIDTFKNHYVVGMEFGSDEEEWLSVGDTISFLIAPTFSDMTGAEDTNRFLMFVSDGLTIRLYPFVGLINPSFTSYEKPKEQRGLFQPFVSITGNIFLGYFNPDVGGTFAITIDPVYILGFGLDLKAGFEIANTFYAEVLWRILSKPSASADIYNSNDVKTGKQTYIFDLNTMGIGAGFRF